MNSPLGRRCAEGFAGRLAGPPAATPIRRGYRIAFGREPTDAEIAAGHRFPRPPGARRYAQAGKPDPARLALVDLCQALDEHERIYLYPLISIAGKSSDTITRRCMPETATSDASEQAV